MKLRRTSHTFFQAVPQHQSYKVACKTIARAQTTRVSARQCDRKLRAVVSRPMRVEIFRFFSASLASESNTWVVFLFLGGPGPAEKPTKLNASQGDKILPLETWSLETLGL